MPRWPSFVNAAKSLLTRRVRVTASGQTGGLHGPQPAPATVIVDDWPVSLQPRSSYETSTVAGKFTDATMLAYGPATDHQGHKWPIRKGHTVEEFRGDVVAYAWEVTDDPENYAGVFLLVPLRPRRV